MRRARPWIVLVCVAVLCACDVSSGGPPGKTLPPGSSPAVPIVLAPSSLTFASPSDPAQSVAVSESRYTAAFSVDATACAGIASAALAANGQSFSVTPLAAGSCTIVVRDAQSGRANLPVTVAP